MVAIKDFIYLDDERVRSYLAQIDGGLIEKTDSNSAHKTSIKGSAKAEGITKLFLDTEAGAEYAFQKSKSETSTLHHAAFELLVSKLRKAKLIQASKDESRPFSNIECSLRLVDYSVLIEQLKSMGLLMPLFDKISGKSPSQENKATAKQMKDMSEAIRLLYGDAKILQLVSRDGDEVLAQASLAGDLSLPVQNLFQSSSDNVLPGTWRVFCIHEQDTPVIKLSPGDNEISKALTTAAEEVKKLRSIISATADASTVIPIAIYRELQ